MSNEQRHADLERLQACERKARAVLGVSGDAPAEDIRRAFLRAAKAYHPDRNGGDVRAATLFQLAHCAYKFLTEGEVCPALESLDEPPPMPAQGKYRLDNPWGYWCWWRESYFKE